VVVPKKVEPPRFKPPKRATDKLYAIYFCEDNQIAQVLSSAHFGFQSKA